MIKRKLAKVLALQYTILASILILLAAGLVLLPKYEKHEGLPPEELLANALSPERYVTTDELASKIVNQDPSLLLIDLRDEQSFRNYSLPNAIHIPLGKLLDDDSKLYLDQDALSIVFYSDDNFYSDMAWTLCNRLGYKNLHVLRGGVNEWFRTIINPPLPAENMPATAFEVYSSRKAASMYFGVAYPEEVSVKKAPVRPEPKQVVPVTKKKKKLPEGGC